MDVSVIIVNYNTCELLENCLHSIYNYTHGLTYEIIVVDNASSDTSKEMVKNKYPGIKLIESEENLGFGRANNLGFEYASGRNIFLLNSDTLLIENSIKILSDILDNDNTIGAVGGMLIGTDNQQVHSYGNFPSIKGKIFREVFIIDKIEFNENKNVDYITGADIMIPRSVWLKVGGFDSHFFMYYEETDFQKRMASLGLKRVIVPSTKIIHLEGGGKKNIPSTSNLSEKKNLIKFQSMIYYMKKHSSILGFLLLKTSLKIKYSYKSFFQPEKSTYYNHIIECINKY